MCILICMIMEVKWRRKFFFIDLSIVLLVRVCCCGDKRWEENITWVFWVLVYYVGVLRQCVYVSVSLPWGCMVVYWRESGKKVGKVETSFFLERVDGLHWWAGAVGK